MARLIGYGSVARLLAIVGAGTAAAVHTEVIQVSSWLTDHLTDAKFRLASSTAPLLRALDPEDAHRLSIEAAKAGLFPRDRRPDDARLNVKLWGRTFSNPIGIAAGLDKDAEAIEGLLDLGLGFMEVGSIPPQAQPGNPKPRCFRLEEHEAVINRYGFNSRGADDALGRLALYNQRRKEGKADMSKVLAINLGKNKQTEDAAEDFGIGVQKLSRYADMLVINVSSPNTPGLRALQGRRQLQDLITRVQASMARVEYPHGRPPLLVKIAPDLTDADLADVAAVAMATNIDGLVVGNTTVSRPGAAGAHAHAGEAGGLSGAPLFDLSTQVLRDMYTKTKGQVVLIGCGGVSSGEQAYVKIKAGASLVELYTGMVYKGPELVPRMKKELLKCLDADGYACIQDAVAADHKHKPV